MRILHIEPDEYYQHELAKHLDEQFDIITAADAYTADSLLASAAPDIVVSELLLADGPSYAFLEKLRKQQNNSALPIIIFSSIGELGDIEATLSLGVAGYFVKGKDQVNDVKKLLLSLSHHNL